MKKTIATFLAFGTLSALAADIKLTDLSKPFSVNSKSIKSLVKKKENLNISCTLDPATKKSIDESSRKDQEMITREVVTKQVTDSVSRKVTQEVSHKLTHEFKSGLRTDLREEVLQELKNSSSIRNEIKSELAISLRPELKKELEQEFANKFPYAGKERSSCIKDVVQYYNLQLIAKEDLYLHGHSYQGASSLLFKTKNKRDIMVNKGHMITLTLKDIENHPRTNESYASFSINFNSSESNIEFTTDRHLHYPCITLGKLEIDSDDFLIRAVKKKFVEL